MEIPCAKCGEWKDTSEIFTVVFDQHVAHICKPCSPEVEEIVKRLEERSRGNTEIPRGETETSREEQIG